MELRCTFAELLVVNIEVCASQVKETVIFVLYVVHNGLS